MNIVSSVFTLKMVRALASKSFVDLEVTVVDPNSIPKAGLKFIAPTLWAAKIMERDLRIPRVTMTGYVPYTLTEGDTLYTFTYTPKSGRADGFTNKIDGEVIWYRIRALEPLEDE